jgi:hypothetical protein
MCRPIRTWASWGPTRWTPGHLEGSRLAGVGAGRPLPPLEAGHSRRTADAAITRTRGSR